MNNLFDFTFYIVISFILSILTTYLINLYFNYDKKLIIKDSIREYFTQYISSTTNYKIFIPLVLFSLLAFYKLKGLNGIFLLEFELFILVYILYYAAIIDIRTKEIPNFLIIIMFANKLLQLPFYMFTNRQLFFSMIITLVIVFLILFIIHFISKGALGMGDVKLLSALSLYIGGYGIYSVIFAALITSLIAAIFLITVKKRDRKYEIPFVPSIFVGYIAFLLFSI